MIPDIRIICKVPLHKCLKDIGLVKNKSWDLHCGDFMFMKQIIDEEIDIMNGPIVIIMDKLQVSKWPKLAKTVGQDAFG